MTTDVALLGLDVESGPVKKAANRNKEFSESAHDAEKSAGSLEKASRGLSGTMGTLARVAAGVTAAFFSFSALEGSVSTARNFNSALAETSTLIEGSARELQFLESSARSMSREFGGTATAQVEGFYQAISAGAGSVEEASRTLDAANRFAIGGVTDVATSVDALTTATNAYRSSGLLAAEASDALFVGIRAGKTTAGELASSLGQIVPIASSVGVSFDEIVAGIAALTTQGQSTSQATTGLRQVLASVIAPTKEAADTAEALGIAFNTQALQAQGLSGFLQDVVTKTGGSQEAMASLFGSVEALNAVLAFSGSAGGTLVEILEQMEDKAGSTEAAFNKVSESLNQRLLVQLSLFADTGLAVGNMLLSVIVPALEVFTSNLDLVASALIGLTVTQIPAMIALLPTLTGLVGAATTAFSLLATAVTVAGGPIGILVALIAGSAAYFLLFRDNAAEAEQATYDAAAGTAALNEALGVFHQSASPAAVSAAINLANANFALADSALAAAEAELRKKKAALEFAEGAGLGSQSSIRDMGVSASQAAQDVEQSTAKVEAAIAGLSQARDDLNRTLDTVRVPGTAPVTPEAPDVNLPSISIPELPGISGGGGGGSLADSFEERLEALQNGLATERETLDAWYQEGLDILNDRRASELLSEAEHREALLRLEQEYNDGLAKIREKTNNSTLSQTGDFFGDMASIFQSGGGKLLQISKVFGAGQALISSLVGAAKALELPFPANLAAAAKVLATGYGFVNSIKGVTSGGSSSSGGAGSGPSGDPSRSTDTQPGPQEPLRVLLEASDENQTFTIKQIQEMFDGLQKEAGNRGVQLVVSA